MVSSDCTVCRTGKNRYGLLICIAVVFALLVWQLAYVCFLNDGLSRKAHSHNESNVARAGQKYVEKGFGHDYGLPDLCYGSQFSDQGFKRLKRAETCVYTHYPPGPDLMAGVLTKIFGVGRLTLFRLWPIAWGICCIGFFAWRLVLALGANRAAAVLVACAAAPMFCNAMHALHYEGYAFGLLLVQWALLIDLFRVPFQSVPKKKWAALALLGFLQGWLSFDYFFLVTFSAVPFWLWQRIEDPHTQTRSLGACVAAPLIGFTLAHGLHFLQVALYYGSLHQATADFFEIALERSGPVSTWWLILVYGMMIFTSEYIFSTALVSLCAIAGSLLILPQGGLAGRNRSWAWKLAWEANRKRAWVLAAALVVSGLWIIVMRAHAMMPSHAFLLSRHFFLFYFFCILFVIQSVRNTCIEKQVPTES